MNIQECAEKKYVLTLNFSFLIPGIGLLASNCKYVLVNNKYMHSKYNGNICQQH